MAIVCPAPHRALGERQAGWSGSGASPGGGLMRVATRGEGKKPPPEYGDAVTGQSRCQTGPPLCRGALTRAIRSHLPRQASESQRLAVSPPSTKPTQISQKSIIGNPWFTWCGAMFRRLELVTAGLGASRQRVEPEKLRTSFQQITQLTPVACVVRNDPGPVPRTGPSGSPRAAARAAAIT